MKSFPLMLLIALTACSSGGALMTMPSFYEIPVGASTDEVVAQAGKPYAIHKKGDGSFEYEYIERINASGRNIEERHYYILIKEGRVVSKRVQQSSPPPTTFDSYEMQTTQNSPLPAE